ncbi:hypothetical protein ACFLWY_02620 [Chloroflexota bacterium]
MIKLSQRGKTISKTFRRMKEEEARLEAESKVLLQQAVAVDEEEYRRYGKDKRGDELPKELGFRESRLRKIREAREALRAGLQRSGSSGQRGKLYHTSAQATGRIKLPIHA